MLARLTKDNFKKEFRSMYDVAVKMISTGKKVSLEIKYIVSRRSTCQNSFYWINCKSIAECLNDAGLSFDKVYFGNIYRCKYSKDEVHDLTKLVLGVDTTTKMSTSEFCDFMTQVFVFWQEKTNYNWVPLESPRGYLEKHGFDIVDDNAEIPKE